MGARRHAMTRAVAIRVLRLLQLPEHARQSKYATYSHPDRPGRGYREDFIQLKVTFK